mmetsp:Transcript_17292/g.37184  ORF Transcript_17292/g.37184 Transcript_17292/m.37184 type:complete len:209 (+) Transcript_17292:2293-2919(+)
MVRLPDHVVVAAVLEDLVDSGDALAGQLLEGLEFVLQLLDNTGAGCLLGQSLHANFHTIRLLREVDDALVAATEFLEDVIASLGEGLVGHLGLLCVSTESLAVLAEVVLHEPVNLLDVQLAGAVEVEEDEALLHVAEGLLGRLQDPAQERLEALHARGVEVFGLAASAVEALQDGPLQEAAVRQEACDDLADREASSWRVSLRLLLVQ